jgi:hypothetical protein
MYRIEDLHQQFCQDLLGGFHDFQKRVALVFE